MKRTSISTWWQSLRAYSLTMSLLPPVIVCLLMRSRGAPCEILLFICFCSAVLLFHIGTNVLNDYHDHRSGVDADDAPGPSGVIQQRKTTPLFMLRSGTLYFILALCVSAPIVMARPVVLLPGGAGAAVAYFYTNRSFSLKYHRLGEIAVFMLFGPLLFFCAALSFTGGLRVVLLPVSLPFGLYAAAVLFINNTRDRTRDRDAGIRTLPMLLGHTGARSVFVLLFSSALLLLNLVPERGGTLGQWPLLIGSFSAAAVIVPLSFRRNIDRLPEMTASALLPLSLLYIIRILW